MHYTKTQEGITALQTRDRILSTKQRQLLILIGGNEFEKLSDILKAKLCTSDVIDSLLSLGFIKKEQSAHSNEVSTPQQHEVMSTVHVAKVIDKTLAPQAPAQEPILTTQNNQPEVVEIAPVANTYDDVDYSLDNMKSLIATALTKYCGLMARAHANNVMNCDTVSAFKRSHMISITLLQESNIPKSDLKDLNKILQNFYEKN